ncbi:MAG: hypothetical protein IJ762_07365 [Bacteroidaceae bacterium]|nr:hypothetical protein [Bacteroidaceae bacterium]
MSMIQVKTKEELKEAIEAKEIDIFLEGDARKEVLRTNAQAMLTYMIGAVMVIVSGIVLIFFLPSDNSLMTTIVKAILYSGGAVLLAGLWMKQFKGYDAECLPNGQVRVKNF